MRCRSRRRLCPPCWALDPLEGLTTAIGIVYEVSCTDLEFRVLLRSLFLHTFLLVFPSILEKIFFYSKVQLYPGSRCRLR